MRAITNTITRAHVAVPRVPCTCVPTRHLAQAARYCATTATQFCGRAFTLMRVATRVARESSAQRHLIVGIVKKKRACLFRAIPHVISSAASQHDGGLNRASKHRHAVMASPARTHTREEKHTPHAKRTCAAICCLRRGATPTLPSCCALLPYIKARRAAASTTRHAANVCIAHRRAR